MTKLCNALFVGACCCTIHNNANAFTTPSSSYATTKPTTAATRMRPSTTSSSASSRTSITPLNSYRNSQGFVGFRGDDAPQRDYNGRPGQPINSRRSMDDPFAPPPSMMNNSMRGQIISDRQSSNLSPYSRPSVNEDPRGEYDVQRRYSQMPHPADMLAPHVQQQTRGYDGRIQGGSRQTYQNYDNGYGYGSGMGGGGQTTSFVETDGRPLDVEMELWEGPNNTPTKVRMYSEDGRQRPMNILTGGGGSSMGGRSSTTSIRNVGSMEFPVRAGVSAPGGGGGMGGGMGMMGGGMGMMDGMGGPMGGGMYGGAPIRSMNNEMMMMSPSGMRPHDHHRSPQIPSMSRGETVQGGSLKTFTLPAHVNAAQVTITSDGLPVNAKVELWGTSSHIKQLAEVYNDNGATRPFAAVLDVPGGENTIAVRNTGPLEYPIRVVVEPVGGMMDGGGRMDGGGMDGGRMDGRMGGGPGGMMGGPGGGGGYGGPPMPMMMGGGGYGPPMGGPYLPPPPF